MAKATEFVTPTGVRGNLLSPSSWIQVILGTVVLIVGFAIGQNVAGAIGRKVPMIDTQPDQFFKPMASPSASVPTRERY